MTLNRWQQLTEWPLIAVSLLFLAAYSLQVLGRGTAAEIAGVFITATWGLFLIDYLVSLALAPHRGKWFLKHLPDLAIVLLPMLRPLRLLRLITVISVLQRVAGNALRGRVVSYVVGGSALLIYLAALAMFDAERDSPGATITSFGDALWWAVVTITTVGYGDLSPTTALGRMIAVGLMIGGITLLGMVTATLASWLVQKVSAEDTASQAATVAHIELLRDEIRALRTLAFENQKIVNAFTTNQGKAEPLIEPPNA